MSRRAQILTNSTGRERAAGLALAVALAIAGGWLAYALGPKPEARVEASAPTASAPPAERRADSTLRGPIALVESLGSGATRVASGRAQGTADDFVETIVETYRVRGFVRIDENPATGRRATRRRARDVYMVVEAPARMVIAVGANAAPTTIAGSAGEASAYVTIASDMDGGVAWATYRYDASGAAPTFALDASADFPGQDPAGIPRLPGSRRVFATAPSSGRGAIACYETSESVARATEFFTREMASRFWSLGAAHPGARAAGTFLYTQGASVCALTIRTNRDGKTAVVVVVR
jgi:hypothetical protein